MGVVTVSASYGAGGSEIGPAVAEARGLPVVDRGLQHYHLVLDTTVIPWETAADVVVSAARACVM